MSDSAGYLHHMPNDVKSLILCNIDDWEHLKVFINTFPEIMNDDIYLRMSQIRYNKFFHRIIKGFGNAFMKWQDLYIPLLKYGKIRFPFEIYIALRSLSSK